MYKLKLSSVVSPRAKLIGTTVLYPFSRSLSTRSLDSTKQDHIESIPSCSVLTRDFIHRSLYSKEDGYFMHRNVVGSPAKPIQFDNILGRREFEQVVDQLYKAHDEAWLTPAELFAPYYSYALAATLLAKHDSSYPIRIIEIGAGNGTNARHICDFIRMNRPRLYESLEYTTVEISPALAERQKTQMKSHKDKYHCINCNVLELENVSERLTQEPCFVLALEVLDNLPHDKIVRATKDSQEWLETCVGPENAKFVPGIKYFEQLMRGKHSNHTSHSDHVPTLREYYRPISDKWIQEAKRYFVDIPSNLDPNVFELTQFNDGTNMMSRGEMMLHTLRSWFFPETNETHKARCAIKDVQQCQACFIPTGAVQLLEVLERMLPQHTLVAGDFNLLPQTQPHRDKVKQDYHVGMYTDALNKPVVASKDRKSRLTNDHATYISPRPIGSADIFFATDFVGLQRIIDDKYNRTSSVYVASTLLESYAKRWVGMATTLTGYNPLLEYYTNTSFLLSEPKDHRD